MSKFKSKYEYKNKSDSNFKRYKSDDVVRSSDDCDISQKIKKLELEGLKLRSQVEEILHESNDMESCGTSDTARECESYSTMLDDQVRQMPRYAVGKSGDICGMRSQHVDCGQSTGSSHVEEYRQRLEYIQQKQKQDSFAHQLEKERLNDTIEELKRVNFKFQTDLEKQTNEFRDTERNHGTMIERLRSNLTQLLSVNKKQEETLIESSERLEELNGSHSAMRAIEHLRDLLMDTEYCRGSSFMDDRNVESGAPNILIGIVEKCFKEYNTDLENRSRKIKDLEDDIIQIKRNLTHDREKSLHELRNQLAYTEEQNNYLKQHVNELNENADREIEKLREENSIIKMKMDEDIGNATSVIDGLERNLQELSNKHKKMNETWTTEKKSFQKILDGNEKQTATIRSERDQALNQKSSIGAKLDATQSQLSETETNLLQLQSEKYSFDKQIEALKKRNKEMEMSIASSRKHLESIIKTVRSCNTNRENSNNNFEDLDDSLVDNEENDEDRDRVWKPKKYQIDQIIQQITSLSKKEKEGDSKYEQLQKEYESVEKQLETVDFHRRKIEQSYKAQQLDIDSAKNENAHITSLIGNRNGEIERLTAERDYYFQLLNEKTEELATVKTEKHRLAVSLEERCRLLESQNAVMQTNDNQRSHIIDTTSGKNDIIKEDRNRLLLELKEAKAAYEELLSLSDDNKRSLHDIRQENWNLMSDLKNIHRDYDDIVAENRTISLKLRDSENEITNLCRELQNHHGAKSKKNLNVEKKVADLVSDLASSKSELKIAHERIRYLEKGCSKSNSKTPPCMLLNTLPESQPVANNMKLTKSRLNSLEQQMKSLEISQKDLKEENYKLTDLLKKITGQNERMTEELESYVAENKRLRHQVKRFEMGSSNGNKKSQQVLKKLDDKSDYWNLYGENNTKSMMERPSDDYLDDNGNDESIKHLRGDLQDSIKEAKRLLSSTPLIEINEDRQVRKESSHSTSKSNQSRNSDSNNMNTWSSRNHHHKNGTNNSSINKSEQIPNLDTVDSSNNNTRRSESTSLTEADRYLSLPLNKSQTKNNDVTIDQRAPSPIQELFSSNKSPNLRPNKSHRDSYLLDEKIKRLLTTES